MTGVQNSDITDLSVNVTLEQVKIGELTAELNWLKCSDINGTFHSTKTVIEQIRYGQAVVNRKLSILSQNCTEQQLSAFKNYLNDIMHDRIEACERRKELMHRPHGLNFDSGAIINLTDINVPYDILVGLSFGHKFVFPFNLNSQNTNKVLALLEYTIEKAVSPVLQDMAAKEIYLTLKNQDNSIHCPINKWLNFVKYRTDRFLSHNTDLAAIRSDKGNHTVLIHINDYKNKILEHLQNPAYKPLTENPLEKLILMESNIVEKLKQAHQTKPLVKGFQPNTLCLPIFYGVIKIHKEHKIRPITSTSGAVGTITSKTLQTMIAKLFPRQPHHIKDSFDFKQRIDNVVLKENDVMVSMDIVSMYTSIPTDLVFKIIMSKAQLFAEAFGLCSTVLIDMLRFVLVDCAVFQFDDNAYRQTAGLPMGGAISPIAAALVMDHIVDSFNSIYPEPLSFLSIFVDDSIFILQRDMTQIALEILNNCVPGPIRFTMEQETNGQINFLNLTLKRDGKSITTNWYKKNYASDRLLNYFSNHKRSIILGTAKHFIKTVLLLSDGQHFQENKTIVENRLRQNNFPEDVISHLVNHEYTLMRPFSNRQQYSHTFYQTQHSSGSEVCDEPNQACILKNKTNYVSYPHAIGNKKIKTLLHHYIASDIVLADSIKNTRNNNIHNLKDKKPLSECGNVIVVAQCQCKKHYKIDKTNFNETGLMVANRLCNTLRTCRGNIHAFNKVNYMKGMAFDSQNAHFMKYVRWKFRNGLMDGRLNLPNIHFAKLLR